MPKHSELQVLHSNAGYYIGRNDAENYAYDKGTLPDIRK
jgi:hypothetical protein